MNRPLILLALLLFPALFISGQDAIWLTDLTQAREVAEVEDKPVLLFFSGSDWCRECIALKKEVFEDPAFIEFAGMSLVLVNADFPRAKKNLPAEEERRHFSELADQYNPEGSFPTVVLLDREGSVISYISRSRRDAPGYVAYLREVVKNAGGR